jgi:hypothetical protein
VLPPVTDPPVVDPPVLDPLVGDPPLVVPALVVPLEEAIPPDTLPAVEAAVEVAPAVLEPLVVVKDAVEVEQATARLAKRLASAFRINSPCTSGTMWGRPAPTDRRRSPHR